MKKAYYNENDPYAAQWLRNLLAKNLIAQGDVDERSIVDVRSDDLKGYTQCHFFAGIGGWSLALRLALWPDDRPVWTGSCPCQPFSSAGKKKGKADERHLWPVWFNLIRECGPSIVFGEQVAAAIAHGWWDDVANDMEKENYACAASVLPACSVGKPHKRDRLWFVAHSEHAKLAQPLRDGSDAGNTGLTAPERPEGSGDVTGCSSILAYTAINDAYRNAGELSRAHERQEKGRSQGWVAESGCTGSLGNAELTRLEGQSENGKSSGVWQTEDGSASASDTEWIKCQDGKVRPVKSGLCLLAHGVPARVGKLRAYGNAIVPQVAAEFIKAATGE